MKYVIMGAGAVGGSLAGLMGLAGMDVTLIARGENLKAMREKGLILDQEYGAGEQAVRNIKFCSAEEYLASGEHPDGIFLTTKTYSVASAAPFLQEAAGPDTIILPIMNGISVDALTARYVHDRQIANGCLYIVARKKAPGHIWLDARIPVRIIVGSDDPSVDAGKLASMAEEFQAKGFKFKYSPDIMESTLKKFAYVSPMGAAGYYFGCGAELGQKPGPGQDLFVGLIHDLAELAGKMGIELPGLAEKGINIAQHSDPKSVTSMQSDIASGHISEFDNQVVEPIRLGQKYGVKMEHYRQVAEKAGYNHKILAMLDYTTPEQEERVREAAEKLGYTLTFTHSYEEAAQVAGDEEILFTGEPRLVPLEKHLKWLSSPWAGAEAFIATGAFDDGRIAYTNGSGAYGVTIAEHIVMVSLMLMRKMPAYQKIVAEGAWERDLPIRSIYGSTVVICGTGNIGSTTARRMKGLGAAKVIGLGHSGRASEPAFDAVDKSSEWAKYLPEADLLVMAMPSTPETIGFLNAEKLAVMKPTAYAVNVGRGTAVVDEDLCEALNSGKLAGAALDVFHTEPLPAEDPLRSCANIILTPHVSGNMTLGYTADFSIDMFCKNLAHWAAGEPLEHRVNIKKGY